MDVISIDSTNAIYQKIQARSLTDLYTKAGVSVSSAIYTPIDVTVPTQYDPTKDSATDKFWIPSQLEAYTIIGGNALNGDGAMDISNYDKTYIKWKSPAYAEYLSNQGDPEASWNAYYWLRSPDPSYADLAFYVDSVALVADFRSVYDTGCAARAAFILNF